MKKKLLTLLIAAIAVIACAFGLAGCAATPDDGDYNSNDTDAANETNVNDIIFELNNNQNSYSVSAASKKCETIIIPTSYENFPVTGISNSAFKECSSLTSITIPDSVTSIGKDAFSSCTSLISITIPNSVTTIGESAFLLCSSLTSVTIGDSVTGIYNHSFSGCSSLTSITIPNSVKWIGRNAFSVCSSLTSITIPNSVTSIDQQAFSSCSSLKNIVIPDSVTSIGRQAFSGCSIESATIPLIALDEIKYCRSNLKEIQIINGDYIFNSAISGCPLLTSITIPESVTNIKEFAIVNCPLLTTINFKGTTAQWGILQKDKNWYAYTGNFTVHCTDGDISYN